MSAYRRIGGPNAITVWSYSLSLVVLLVVTTIPSERDQFIGSLGQRLLLATVGTSAGFVVLALAWLTVLRPGARACSASPEPSRASRSCSSGRKLAFPRWGR